MAETEGPALQEEQGRKRVRARRRAQVQRRVPQRQRVQGQRQVQAQVRRRAQMEARRQVRVRALKPVAKRWGAVRAAVAAVGPWAPLEPGRKHKATRWVPLLVGVAAAATPGGLLLRIPAAATQKLVPA